ncbi:MAG TPA: hypothetical protein VK762_32680, partial [Polyangiaceae bacterium]|nr:hypothetical protein [Polyangiaceae bacterium]
MHRNRVLWSAALGIGLGIGASACNGLLGNDSVSLWGGADSGRNDGTLRETDDGASLGMEGGDGTADTPIADASGDTSLGAGSGTASDGASDSGTEGGVCTDECFAGQTECASSGGAIQKCDVRTNGCTQWVTTSTCGPHQTCTGGSVPSCTCTSSICAQTGTACQNGQTLATCAIDGNNCAYVASTSMCPSPQSCSGTPPSAVCSATCASSCTSGQTSCVSGGLATCTLGSNGCRAYGAPAACGTLQSCTGAAGSSACTCNTDPVCSAAGKICTSASASATCSTDTQGCIYESGSSACTNQTCASGVCTGVCGPGQTHPIACGNCGVDTQTCSGSGAWQDATCTGQGVCSQNATQSCNTYGTQTCGSSCTWGTCSCASAPVCTPNATQCAGNGVQTCNSCGQWGSAVACPASTPSCNAGSCGQPLSCQQSLAGLTNCGSASESCCTSPQVPGGSFDRTYANSGDGGTGEADPASVSGFRLDKYSVTVARFRQFVTAWNNGSGYLPADGSGKHAYLNGGMGLMNSGAPGTYEAGWSAANDSNVAPTTTNLDCAYMTNQPTTW